MNPKSVNGNNRSANGFFLTSRADNQKEQAILEVAVRCISNELRLKKIRAFNVLTNLKVLQDIVELGISEVRKEQEAQEIVSNHDEQAYVWLVVVACISWYNQLTKVKDE